jgi:acetolactate synthase I/II/III large subunit
MKTRGSKLVVRALADEGVRFTFGIPGTHNTELYDALVTGPVEPVLVTDEQCASFLADGLARTSDQVGVLNLVPGAGVTHSLSGVAEAFLDQVPMVVLACGIRTDTGNAFQLHDIDQLAVLRPVTKEALRAETAADIYPLIRHAFQVARRAPAGPVAVEIPANLLLLTHDVPEPSFTPEPELPVVPDPDLLESAARMLSSAAHPALYLGAGAADAGADLVELAERLGAPVTTTFSGKGVFPELHPLWLWPGFGAQAPPFVRKVMGRCDCLLAIGCRFAEVATGSYGLQPPRRLIHVDVDHAVFNRNFRAELVVPADAAAFVRGLLGLIGGARPSPALQQEIAAGHRKLGARRTKPIPGRVRPEALLAALQRLCRPDTVFATDSGNGTFLAVEQLRLSQPGCFIAPVDYSCMGYSVPAAIGAALANPGRDVVALAGDGALLMTGLELLTAVSRRAAPLVVVLRDRKLGQIAQFQQLPYNRTTCTVLPDYSVDGLALATGCRYFRVVAEVELEPVLAAALEAARSHSPALVEVMLDDSRTTHFTRGVLRTNFRRLPWSDRLRMVGRAIWRRVTG